jgi:hypothetical protein
MSGTATAPQLLDAERVAENVTDDAPAASPITVFAPLALPGLTR